MTKQWKVGEGLSELLKSSTLAYSKPTQGTVGTDVIPEAMTQTELPVSRTCPVFLPVLAAAGNEHQCCRKEGKAKYTRKGSRRDQKRKTVCVCVGGECGSSCLLEARRGHTARCIS